MNEGAHKPARRRLFFALWPDAEIRRAICDSTSAAVDQSRGRRVKKANLHLTLAFLGNVETERATQLERMPGVREHGFDCVLDTLGYARRARVLWIEPSVVPPALERLEENLWSTLSGLGFEREKRPFRPHVTLARHATRVRTASLRIEWSVRAYSLVESVSTNAGSHYTKVCDWPLAG